MFVWTSSVSPMDPPLRLCQGLNALCIYQWVSAQRGSYLGTVALRREAGKGRGKRVGKRQSRDPEGEP